VFGIKLQLNLDVDLTLQNKIRGNLQGKIGVEIVGTILNPMVARKRKGRKILTTERKIKRSTGKGKNQDSNA